MKSDMQSMVSVSDAVKLIRDQITPLEPRKVILAEANETFLAEDIIAPYNIPAFPQSGMDGYAINFDSIGKPIQMSGEMAAGSNAQIQVSVGEAVRIFTGAAVPSGADTVVIQEKTKRLGNELIIEDENLQRGQNIRAIGSEITAGTLALPKGAKLHAASIGFLASIGVHELSVYPKPRVSIIVTGNELQNPGIPLEYGQVYEANSFALTAALDRLGIKQIRKHYCPDNPDQLESILHQELESSDLILLTGGVSVGDYDFTAQAFETCNVKKIFHKIKQKPGKPILFGMSGNKPVFGLPGNPASVLTCFYEYVYHALNIMMKDAPEIIKTQAIINEIYKKPSGITHFLKAFYEEGKVTLLSGQESYKLNSFARANALAVIPEELTEVKPGSTIEVHILP
ncbi:MAG: gephyrin-like molybdotransferase Glp [Chitinophagaceae bacterium]